MNILANYLRLMGGADYDTREAILLVANVDGRLSPSQANRVMREHQRQNRRDIAAENTIALWKLDESQSQ